MLRVWRRLLAPCSICVCCAVYDPSLLAGTPEKSDALAGAGPHASGGGMVAGGGSGSIDQGGEAGGGDVTPADPTAGAAGQPAGAGTSGGGSSGSGPLIPGGSGGEAATMTGLVDDFETPNVYGLYQDGRKPLWYLIDDGTVGTQAPMPLEMTALSAGEAATSGTGALFVACSGFSDWGSGVGVDLLNAAGKQPYDLSAYAGVSFWAKVPGSYRVVRVNVPDVGTDPSGELCGELCTDHFGVEVTLSEDWQYHEVLFSAMEQAGWGLQRDELTLSAIYSIHFQVAAGNDVELWIDDLGLIEP